ncbi:MAG TPA: hypothetical protein VGI06_09560 [Acidimicrobiales bacterium]
MERVVVAAALVVISAVVALVLSRRRPQAPTQERVPIPAQLDRDDFPDADKPWLLVVWTSTTCDSCARATGKARLLASSQVGYVEVPWQEQRELHARYGIEDVPLLVLADADGVVQVSFVGAPNFTDLAGAVAEAREPGSTPEPHLGKPHLDPAAARP